MPRFEEAASKADELSKRFDAIMTRKDSMVFTVQAAEEWGPGGVNGMGKAVKVKGSFVMSPTGRRVKAYSAHEKQKADEWAAVLTAALQNGEKWVRP